ncbi:hypothetical protein [Arthrobacter sp. MMS18-M83]|uniref:hypothetical protein n=1 Tax=Arthrobacter sp. MMS18-M83 TaxID=2996261 RepID=UPI002DD443A9|nr:hypothetical protein [Arthrobacter sp. MMS18-M83]
MVEMHLKEQWNRLDPATQQWFMENPGCVIVPRTITATINGETGENADVDLHGGTVLSEEDKQFIQTKARQEAPAYRFFDSIGP